MNSRTELKAARFKDLDERYPPVDPGLFLADQRKWVRRVNTMSALSHVERSAAIFIAMMCSPDRPYCVAGMKFICKQVGCERTAVYRACAKLEAEKLMEIERRRRSGNIYRIVWHPF